MAKLLTPRGYLSWTQVDMWRKSPERYIKNYMLGEDKKLNNSGLSFGSVASAALETGEYADDVLLDAVVALLPHYKLREHEIRVTFKTKYGAVELLGLLDTFDTPIPRFREYKTGRIAWTQAKANKHKQLLHYATLIYLKHGILPPEVWLDWAETEEDEDGTVSFTGNIRHFQVKISRLDVLEYMALVGKVAREIDAEYRKQLKKLA